MPTVKEIMSAEPMILAPESTLAEAIELLARHNCGAAPVIADGEMIGIISELELLDVLFDSALRDSPVSEFMSRQVRTIAEGDSLGHAAHMFALYGIRRLPVLRDGRLVGIISRRDVLLSAIRSDSSFSEEVAGFIPFLDEPITNGFNQDQFLLDNLN